MLYEVKDGKIQTKACEYSVAYHCNLKCAHCSHMAPFIKTKLPPLESFANDVNQLSKVMHAKDIRLVGGEPLLNPEIVEFLKIAKASGIADTIMVTTNGLLLNSMKDEFWENVDFVWLSQYPGASPKDKMIEKFKGKAKEYNTRFDVDPSFYFRTTITTEPHPHDWMTGMIYKTCESAHRFHCHMIHEGRIFKCACPPFMPEYLARMGKNGYDSNVDAFQIHSHKNQSDMFNGLKDFLFSDKPLQACKNCLGYVGTWQSHRQLTKDVVAAPELEVISRETHLDKRRFVQATALYYMRRGKEKLTGSRQW
jgi:MoaA/NifB/PqqE/SkfB family radical SAM enzyme